MNKQKISNIFELLQKQTPNPKTELNYENDFTLLMAIVLSAQATDLAVNKVTSKLFKLVQTPIDLINLGEQQLKSYISSIGLYNSKAKNLIKLAYQVLELGSVPAELKALEELAGVGQKTARVFLNCFYNQPLIAVDTHVFRASKRIGFASGKNAQEVTKELEKNIPKKWQINAHHLLILHGRYTCKARKPNCDFCVIQASCNFFQHQNSLT